MRARSLGAAVCLCLIATLVALGGSAAHASGGTLVYGVNPFENLAVGDHRGLQAFDTSNGQSIGGAQITVVGGFASGDVIGATGLAVNPITGTAYTLLRMGSFENPRILASIDLTNGHATTLGNTGLKITSITFDASGTLYAVSGRGDDSGTPNTCKGCLYSLSLANAAPTFLKQLTNCPGVTASSCGHGIAYDSANGMIYHTSGDDTHPVFEKVLATSPYTITNVGYDAGGVTPDTVWGVGYDAALDRFVMTDWNKHVYSVTPAGLGTQLANDSRIFLKGLYVSPLSVPTDVPPTAVDDVMTTTQGQAVTINATDNDSDADGGVEIVESYTQPAHGTVSFSGLSSGISGGDNRSFPQSVTYLPESGYCNDGSPTDDFTYTLNGGSTATVRVTVTCVPFTGPLVFGVNTGANYDYPGESGLAAFDAATGILRYEKTIQAVFPSKITGDVDSATALAMNPRNRKVYAVLYMDAAGAYALATLDPATGDAVTLGLLGHNLIGLTFGGDGTLYGVSGPSDPTCFECLFVVDTTKGTAKAVKKLAAPNGYESIAFNPRDGKIYRATDTQFQSIDPRHSYAIKNIGYGGLIPNGPIGLGYDAASGGFVLTDYSTDVWLVATNGGATGPISSLSTDLAGVVVANPTLSLKYSTTQKRFSGKLATPMIAGCDGVRTVSIFKETSGPPTFLGAAATDATGKFVLSQKVGRGKYHASVDPGPDSGGLPCAGGQSKTITVR